MNIKAKLPIFKDNKEEKDPDGMDLIMRTIKAVHSAATNETFKSKEDLDKQRAEVERFSKLVAPSHIVNVEAFDIDGMPAEWATPISAHRKDIVIMYCHGGGYTCGGIGYARVLATKLALHTGIRVMSFEYRLAPENPYPSAIEDALKAWDYLMKLGYGARDIIVAGDSAGGNLSLELVLELKKAGRFCPGALVLMSPWTDMRLEASSYKTYADKDPMLTYNYVASVRQAYAGDDVDYSLPQYSPLLADLTEFPPTLIQVGSNEILRGDSEHLAKHMNRAGSYAKLEVYQGGWHVFQQMPLPRAAHAVDNIAAFINNVYYR